MIPLPLSYSQYIVYLVFILLILVCSATGRLCRLNAMGLAMSSISCISEEEVGGAGDMELEYGGCGGSDYEYEYEY